MGIYKGIEQVTKSTYDNISSEDKVGTLYFVRDNEDNKTTEIYFGNRQYALSENSIMALIQENSNGGSSPDLTEYAKITDVEEMINNSITNVLNTPL